MAADTGPSARSILDDVTVVDLTTFVTGGFSTLMLANQGAEVIKVERPEMGDTLRHSGPPFVEQQSQSEHGRTASDEGESPYFWTVNSDKRSIEINLRSEDGRAVLYDLVAEADVVIENYRPGTAEKLGVSYEDLEPHNEELIYCSISAFGETGPWSGRPGYDLLVQGMSGIMEVTGEESGPPVKVGIPLTDLITGMWASFGIVGALYRRARTGEGDRIELGMLDATLPWLTKQAGKAFVGEQPTRMGTRDPVLAPYQTYPTSDGYLNVACGNQKIYEELCEALDRPDLLADPRFESNSARVKHMDALEEELTEIFEQQTTAEWVEELAEGRDLPVGPIHSVSEALDNPQTRARDVVKRLDHPTAGEVPVIDHPLNYTNAESGFSRPPPLLGEHTDAILRDLGYDEEAIDELRASGAIPEHE